MIPSDFSFWWKGFNKDREAVGEELAEIAFEAGRVAENEACRAVIAAYGEKYRESEYAVGRILEMLPNASAPGCTGPLGADGICPKCGINANNSITGHRPDTSTPKETK